MSLCSLQDTELAVGISAKVVGRWGCS